MNDTTQVRLTLLLTSIAGWVILLAGVGKASEVIATDDK